MTVSAETTAKSLILLPLATRRIAFPADSVIELTPPRRLQNFPHKTSWISGVIVRRNRVVPVCDTRQLFGEPEAITNRFYLILEWQDDGARDWCAIPVQGECELLSPGQFSPQEASPDARLSSVFKVLLQGGEEVEVLDLSQLIRRMRQREETAS